MNIPRSDLLCDSIRARLHWVPASILWFRYWKNGLNCLDFLINQGSRSIDGLQSLLIRCDTSIDTNTPNNNWFLVLKTGFTLCSEK